MNNNYKSSINNNNEFVNVNYEIKDPVGDNVSKNECYIKYVTLNREGYEYILGKNYKSALVIFKNCHELSKNFLKD